MLRVGCFLLKKKKDVVLLFVVNWSRRIAVFVSGRRSLGEKSITTVCNVWSTCIHWSNTAASQAETSPIYSIKYSVGCLFCSGWSGYYRIIWIIWWSWKTGSKVHLPNVTKKCSQLIQMWNKVTCAQYCWKKQNSRRVWDIDTVTKSVKTYFETQHIRKTLN